MRFWGGLTKSTPTKVGSRLPKNIFCENVPMSAPNDIVNIKTCLCYVIMRFCHIAKVSAQIQNIFGRTFFSSHPYTTQFWVMMTLHRLTMLEPDPKNLYSRVKTMLIKVVTSDFDLNSTFDVFCKKNTFLTLSFQRSSLLRALYN